MRQSAAADFVAGEPRFVEQYHLNARLVQQVGANAARRARAGHDYTSVVAVIVHL